MFSSSTGSAGVLSSSKTLKIHFYKPVLTSKLKRTSQSKTKLKSMVPQPIPLEAMVSTDDTSTLQPVFSTRENEAPVVTNMDGSALFKSLSASTPSRTQGMTNKPLRSE